MLSLTYPDRTLYHGVGAGPKLFVLSLFTIWIYLVADPLLIGAGFLAILFIYLSASLPFFLAAARHLRPLIYFVAVIVIWQSVRGNYVQGILTSLKFLAAVGIANLVTMTTRLDELIAIIFKLTIAIRMPSAFSRSLTLAIAMVIRFIPTMTLKGKRLHDAWRSRTTRRVGWRIVPPLTILAIDDANQVALSCRARGGLDVADHQNE